MRLVALSDTHGRHDGLRVPDGDVLIHAGDMSSKGTLEELRQFNEWLGELPHDRKLFVPGNHDFCFEGEESRREALELLTEAECLIDASVYVGDHLLWGAPWQPKFFDWAFNRPRGRPLREKWNLIPETTNILVTHGPPYNIGDEVTHGDNVGCRELRKRVDNIRPQYHLFGHIHEGYGRYRREKTTFINCSTCDVRTTPRNRPIVIEL